MNRFYDIRALASLLAACLLAVALGSCSDDSPAGDPVPGVDAQPEYVLGLYVETGDNVEGSSRAPYNGTYDRGAAYENYIDIAGGDFRVALFTADKDDPKADNGTLICVAENPDIVPVESGIGSKRYLLNFRIPVEDHDLIHGRSIRLVMLANWGNYPDLSADGLTLAGLYDSAATCAITYSNSETGTNFRRYPGYPLTVADKIPLFGVCQYDDVELQLEWATMLSKPLHLLRSLAKVEVWPAEGAVEMTEVCLTRHIPVTMPMPKGVMHQDDYVTNSYDTDYGPGPSIPDGAQPVVTPLQLHKVTDADGANPHFYVYVPEYPNIADGKVRPDQDRSQIRIIYADGNHFDLDFAYYTSSSDGSPSTIDTSKGTAGHFDILRNYWYRFEISKDRKIEVQVHPYTQILLEPGFGIQSDANYVAIRNENNQIIYWYDPQTGKFYGLDKKIEIPNPNINEDPNGWVLSRDENDQFVCYHDVANGKFYGWDRKTEIAQPSMHVDPETGWLIIQNLDGTRIYYYYDRINSRWYLPDKETTVERPFANPDEIS